MNETCALFRRERIGDKDYYTFREYCDGLEEPFCKYGKSCPFYKWKEKWLAVVVKKQTQYVRIE